jgi:hypothetical protein
MRVKNIYIVKHKRTGQYVGHERKMVAKFREAAVWDISDAFKVARENDDWEYESLAMQICKFVQGFMYEKI